MNKEKLQEHNIDLSEILTVCQNLPGGGVPYSGDNPLTIGTEGATIPANTLIEQALQIVNGVEPGVTGIDYGTITPSSSKITIHHNLGVAPSAYIIFPQNNSGTKEYNLTEILAKGSFALTPSTIYWDYNYTLGKKTLSLSSVEESATKIELSASYSFYGTYWWIAIA